MSHSEEYIIKRNKDIEKVAVEFTKLLQQHDKVINTMAEHKILENTQKTELDNLFNEDKIGNYLISKVVPGLAEPPYRDFKNILKNTGNAEASNLLPGPNDPMDKDKGEERVFHAHTSDDFNLLDEDKELSKGICYLYSEGTYLASAFIVGPKILDSDTEKYQRYILTTHAQVINYVKSDILAKFGWFDSSNQPKFQVKIQKMYADNKKINYILLALEPSEELEKLHTNITSSRPGSGESLMVFGYPKDMPLKKFKVEVQDDKGGYLKCDPGCPNVPGGLCINNSNPYAMTTEIDKSQAKVAYICDIIGDIKGKIKDTVFTQLFP